MSENNHGNNNYIPFFVFSDPSSGWGKRCRYQRQRNHRSWKKHFKRRKKKYYKPSKEEVNNIENIEKKNDNLEKIEKKLRMLENYINLQLRIDAEKTNINVDYKSHIINEIRTIHESLQDTVNSCLHLKDLVNSIQNPNQDTPKFQNVVRNEESLLSDYNEETTLAKRFIRILTDKKLFTAMCDEELKAKREKENSPKAESATSDPPPQGKFSEKEKETAKSIKDKIKKFWKQRQLGTLHDYIDNLLSNCENKDQDKIKKDPKGNSSAGVENLIRRLSETKILPTLAKLIRTQKFCITWAKKNIEEQSNTYDTMNQETPDQMVNALLNVSDDDTDDYEDENLDDI